ncbi:SPOR domain-containing protein [Xylophilus sp.]|uniref:SPOR domain-containing protein n=1 Tax=Xylophilus sp. TaxID=2653893 RepID=UPI002D7E97B1|nr:SPOR domain-containing protein [Xylophilus sp.]
MRIAKRHQGLQQQQRSRQGGGTLIGLVIGVLVGLGAALAVAVYVTKVPVPFLNKGLARSVDQDAAEARKNRDWDPNSPLYGKNPARGNGAPAAAGSVGVAEPPPPGTVAEPAAPGAPAVAPAPLPAPPAVAGRGGSNPAAAPAAPGATTTARPATSSDPLGDLAKARAAASPGADPFDYFVQAGAFRAPEDAEAQRAKLAIMGWEARVSEREQSGRTVFRVRIGPFAKRDDAEQLKGKLDASGMDTALVRVQR